MKYFRFLLFPFCLLYDLVTRIRNVFFDIGFFKEKWFKLPVIVVGNLSVGGTGKTPQIEYLIRFLKDNFQIGILSRGYKRKTKGFLLLNRTHSAEDVGDEPLQYFKKFRNINVAVHTNRVEGIERLLQEKQPEVILLDDAYQHRKVKASFYILLTKYKDLFVDDFILPTGNLRESSQGAKRANFIVVTKCPENIDVAEQNSIKSKLDKFNKPVFFTTISYAKTLKGTALVSMDDLKEFKVLLITGIANPNPLLDYLTQKGIDYLHLKFPDHHDFSLLEVNEIQQKFEDLNGIKKLILTTEKDYVRLEKKLEVLYFLEIETSFIDDQKLVFDALIKLHIKENQHS
jgi:tetraacyldisaccharide 4'-kinase